ncbi:Hypothetical Protein RradSPS_2783 (plasmid) [Rubrobacter radiotolerans]|uniref:Uncharacterized protein n=1 Tax=Rubrobacter radiotolerans TaxID=42256 RepID=A0A023X7B0_RUBRA|nr:hypothetical protein [Rubrobacter radiotolerans]AHY48066.1 Hypothetical Protein RradSPS_2783 [Rubrobacter radiotolerans]MDX5895341.1 hypothetical protein [Rubrobacter radiotolerans]SMC01668.1 hypothetical protein SAMN00767673_2890 [Rubrobacter radiotolerans DSM 5868]
MEDDSLLTLSAEPWGAFQLRNVHKTNVAWSSYPFLPPTTADGLLASVIEGERWVEGNFHPPRTLRSSPEFSGLAALGGYPSGGHHTRAHLRSHVGTLMSYDGPLWVPPEGVQSAGKKPAIVEDYVCEGLSFLVVGESAILKRLWESVIGRVAPFAKKSVLYFRYEDAPDLTDLRPGEATENTLSLTALPMMELGSMPKHASPYMMPVKSSGTPNNVGRYGVKWSHLNCVWEPGVRIRPGTPTLTTDNGSAISKSLLTAVRQDDA